ncbi:KH domain-containing protein [Miniphocaeibacter halophilus]|uniref:KH domain-containing protein n=1 Tax=Miniphocaeibacter halophilus TaxID=2931922 RepID=A0AC61MS88_9FIRM|nr:KH domain-containing protein [Miniphocaeibacter halophilus]QQK07309.1 KH domain-containing protein [Miniphocaeibacter halophilus]
MVELVETIAKELVENPDAVVVTHREEGNTLIIEVKADPNDLGRIIGKEGRIAKAIRTVVKAAAIKDGVKVVVDIMQ